jgi:hypothetical protein
MLAAERMGREGMTIPEYFERFLQGLAQALVQRGLHRLPDPVPTLNPVSLTGRGRKRAEAREGGEPTPTPPQDPTRWFIVRFYDRYLRQYSDAQMAYMPTRNGVSTQEVLVS